MQQYSCTLVRRGSKRSLLLLCQGILSHHRESYACRSSVEGIQRASIPMTVRIPLAGLQLSLLPDATRGKTPWVRKVPLKLTFPRAELPYSEEAFVLFGESAAEKEQWCATGPPSQRLSTCCTLVLSAAMRLCMGTCAAEPRPPHGWLAWSLDLLGCHPANECPPAAATVGVTHKRVR